MWPGTVVESMCYILKEIGPTVPAIPQKQTNNHGFAHAHKQKNAHTDGLLFTKCTPPKTSKCRCLIFVRMKTYTLKGKKRYRRACSTFEVPLIRR